MPRHYSLRSFVLMLALPAFVTAAVAEPGGPGTNHLCDVSATLETAVKQHGVPGLAAVILQGDCIVAEGAAGARTSGATGRITINGPFLLCSGTKAMTATLVAMAVEEGRLSYTTTLGEIFPDTIKHMCPDWKMVTVAQLLEHCAGVPNEGSRTWTLLRVYFSKGTVAGKRRKIVEKILSRAPKYPPGTRYLYTALDYVVLGAILEKVTGRSWEELVQERLWVPLGITTGGFGTPDAREKTGTPSGHWGAVFKGCPVAPGGFWAGLSMPLFLGPGGAAHMTVTDWAKFVALHLRGDPANPQRQARLLKPDSFALLHRAGSVETSQAGWYVGTRSWARGPRSGDTGRVLASQGDNGFWHAEAWLAPEIDFAVVIVCNQGGAGDKPAARACEDAIGKLLRDFLPRQTGRPLSSSSRQPGPDDVCAGL